jgi:uncharacterized protein YxeA
MKKVIIILFFLILICGVSGFLIKPDDFATGELLIGISIATAVFILMPLFIYYRWRKRSVKDYMLTKENIEKMRKYSKDKKL